MIGRCSCPAISTPISSLVVHRAEHPVAATLAQPAPGGLQQRARCLGVILALKPPEHAPLVVLEAVEVLVDMRADPPDRLPVAVSEEILRLGVLEKRVLARIEALLEVHQKRRDPLRLIAIEPPRELNEGIQLGSAFDGPNLDRHPGEP